MALPATTKGLQDLAALRSRIARDYGRGRISWDDFGYLSLRLNEIEERLIHIATNDPERIALEAQRDVSIT
jgi:hypothetical protein